MVNSSKSWSMLDTIKTTVVHSRSTPSDDETRSTFSDGEFKRSASAFDVYLRHHISISPETWYECAQALASSGRIEDSLEMLAHVAQRIGTVVPLDHLKPVTLSLLTSCVTRHHHPVTQRPSPLTERRHQPKAPKWTVHHQPTSSIDYAIPTEQLHQQQQHHQNQHHYHTTSPLFGVPSLDADEHSYATASTSSSSFLAAKLTAQPSAETTAPSSTAAASSIAMSDCFADPLACALCGDVLRNPMTALCGHTFCADCCGGQTQCVVCGRQFVAFKPDVLVGRLVEKWWSPEANLRAAALLKRHQLDEALKACNESLDKCPNNVQGLLQRSEVLFWLKHFQSSLADADNALKARPTSFKAQIRRAIALAALGFHEDALIAYCVSISLQTKSLPISNDLLQEVAKIIQRLLAPTRQPCSPITNKSTSPPYRLDASSVSRRRHQRRKRESSIKMAIVAMAPHLNATQIFVSKPIDEEDAVPRSFDIDALYGGSDCLLGEQMLGDEAADPLDDRHEPYYRRRKQHNNGSSGASWRRFAGVTIDHQRIPRQNVRFRKILDIIREKTQNAAELRFCGSSNRLKVSPVVVEPSDFDCVLCYRTMWKPVVTPCGHTYCLVCLDRCLDYSSHCPLCKFSFGDDAESVCSIRKSLNRKNVTRFIEEAMQRFIPDVYQKRQRQEIETEPFVPIFVCTTAFPDVSCPLFVHEARYRLMIRRAIESGDRQFGIVQSSTDDPKQHSDFGTMLNIRDCVLMSNGRSILSTVGGRRFRVIDRSERDGYQTAKVQYIYDEPVDKTRLHTVNELHVNVFEKAVFWYKSLPDLTKEEIHQSFGGLPMLEQHWESLPDGPAWAWYIIALLPLGQPLKVEILASTSLEKRLLAINKTLEFVDAQKRRSTVCMRPCEGLQPCQALECCHRGVTTAVNESIIILDDDDDVAMNSLS